MVKYNSTHVIHELRYKVLNEGQFRVMIMDNVKAFHVMYVLRTYKVIHISLVFILLLGLVLSVGFVAVHLCSPCDQLFQLTLSL